MKVNQGGLTLEELENAVLGGEGEIIQIGDSNTAAGNAGNADNDHTDEDEDANNRLSYSGAKESLRIGSHLAPLLNSKGVYSESGGDG